MALAPGTRLGRYEILAPLGAGGMGEVYRARDSRLAREVAIKVLPAHMAESPEGRQRFELEARAISALSHPHICALYDVGSQDGIDYLVMELLAGETLAARLHRGPLPLDQALVVAGEIADALARAHRQGIVHRDLKPANVMLTKTGVKLLDFGLARLIAAPSALTAEVSTSSTRAEPLTGVGMIVGTLQYMAPEQLEGRAIDARTDLFAFGAVLYEMLTGSQAFSGANAASVITAILRDTPPPVSTRTPLAPAALDRLVERLLAKDPEERWQTAHDLHLQLSWIGSTGATPPEPGEPLRRRRGRVLVPLAAGLLAGALIAAVVLLARSGTLPRSPTIGLQITPPGGGRFRSFVETVSMAFSPDGSRFAFIAAGRAEPAAIWIRSLAEVEPHALPGTEGAESLFWAPDGEAIAFFVDGTLKRVGFRGGSPAVICAVPAGSGLVGTWGRERILYAGAGGDAIMRVSPGGGEPVAIRKPDAARGSVRVAWPWFLPDGESFLYLTMREDGEPRLMHVARDDREHEVAVVTSRVEYVDPGYLVFAREGALEAQRFDAVEGRLSGAPVVLAPKVTSFRSTLFASFATSRQGAIAYVAQGDLAQVAWFDRSGRALGPVGSRAGQIGLSISADGTKAATARTRPDLGTYDLWTLDLRTGEEMRMTSDPRTEIAPVWLPDGKGLVYSSSRGRWPAMLLRDLASGAERPLLPRPSFQEAVGVTPDGRRLVFRERTASTKARLLLLELKGGEPHVLVPEANAWQSEAALSVDGRLLAYVSDVSGSSEAYVRRLDGGPSVRVSADGAKLVGWSRNGGEVYFTSPDRHFLAAFVSTAPALAVRAPVTLFALPGLEWLAFEVHPDGRLLAVVKEVDERSSPINVIVSGFPGRP